jgi:hypothetical protein
MRPRPRGVISPLRFCTFEIAWPVTGNTRFDAAGKLMETGRVKKNRQQVPGPLREMSLWPALQSLRGLETRLRLPGLPDRNPWQCKFLTCCPDELLIASVHHSEIVGTRTGAGVRRERS